MKSFLKTAVTAVALGALPTLSLAGGNLVISSNQSDATPKAAVADLVEKFKAAYPDIDVELNTIEHEAYKTAIINFLVADTGPDVGMWFAGNRMAGFVSDGLFGDISSVWNNAGLESGMASTMPSVTFGGKQYGLPYAYYQWGLYVRSDIMKANGISEFNTYDELLAACTSLGSKGVSGVAIGTKYLWTAAGWFDYLNMRTNGLDYHINLMLGKVKYTDDGVVDTMKNWRKALDAGCFMDNHHNYSWQEAQPALINGEAAMYLMGNFLVPNLPKETQDNLYYWQFPDINAGMARGEDAPTDLLFMPANAVNKDNAKKFLEFAARPENIEAIAGAIQNLPTHKDAAPLDDRFLKKCAKVLAASKTAQFYDRDTTQEMA